MANPFREIELNFFEKVTAVIVSEFKRTERGKKVNTKKISSSLKSVEELVALYHKHDKELIEESALFPKPGKGLNARILIGLTVAQTAIRESLNHERSLESLEAINQYISTQLSNL